jgi:hypothetical protein
MRISGSGEPVILAERIEAGKSRASERGCDSARAELVISKGDNVPAHILKQLLEAFRNE